MGFSTHAVSQTKLKWKSKGRVYLSKATPGWVLRPQRLEPERSCDWTKARSIYTLYVRGWWYAEFVPKYGQKLTALVGVLGYWQLSAEEVAAWDSLRGWGLESQEWVFLDQEERAGGSSWAIWIAEIYCSPSYVILLRRAYFRFYFVL